VCAAHAHLRKKNVISLHALPRSVHRIIKRKTLPPRARASRIDWLSALLRTVLRASIRHSVPRFDLPSSPARSPSRSPLRSPSLVESPFAVLAFALAFARITGRKTNYNQLQQGRATLDRKLKFRSKLSAICHQSEN